MGIVLALILVGLKLFSIVNLDWTLVTLFSIVFIYLNYAVSTNASTNDNSGAISVLASHIEDLENRIVELEEKFEGNDDSDDFESCDHDR